MRHGHRDWRLSTAGTAGRALPAAVVVSFLLCAVPALAQPQGTPAKSAPTADLPPGVAARIRAVPDTATVGDPIRMELEIRFPAGGSVQLSPLAATHGDFTILETQPGARPADDTAKRPSPEDGGHYRAVFTAAAFRPGDAAFPPIPYRYRDAAGRESARQTPAAQVKIRSVLTGGETELKGLKQQAEIEEPASWMLWLTLALLVVAAAFAAVLFRRRRRRLSPAPHSAIRDPLALAETELRDLLGRGWLESGMVKPFYVAFSEVVKRMIEAGYEIPTGERTTSEILESARALPGSGEMGREQAIIARLLTASDLVKFARSIPELRESESLIEDAFLLLAECRRRRASPGGGAAEEGGA
jgi:hypothetical protein